MNSGMTASTIRTRRPTNFRIIASASSRPSTNSTATQAQERIAVISIECHQSGSLKLSLKLERPTQGWLLLTEKSNSTKMTQSEKTSGKSDNASTRNTAGETRSQRKCRSNQEERAAAGRLFLVVCVRVAATSRRHYFQYTKSCPLAGCGMCSEA